MQLAICACALVFATAAHAGEDPGKGYDVEMDPIEGGISLRADIQAMGGWTHVALTWRSSRARPGCTWA